MKLTNYYLPTLREIPQDAEIESHKLMLRAGMIRKTVSGIYPYLPLGLKVLRNIEEIVRKRMDESGSIELKMSILQPKEIWEQSGRWEKYGPEMFKLLDRNEREFCLGPTAEEYYLTLIKDELNTYKKLPINLYQIQFKYRDEKRPRFGLNRCREFLMKDAYSFDRDAEGLEVSYKKMEDAYDKIFTDIGLKYVKVLADNGQMGGKKSQEFIALADTGESEILFTDDLSFASNIEKCPVEYKIDDNSEMLEAEEVFTPDKVTIEEVSGFLGVKESNCVKVVDLLVNGEKVFVLIPGDRVLNETKLINYLKVAEHDIEMMDEKAILDAGSYKGFTGPINLNGRIIADERIPQMKNMVIGANKKDYHIKNANYNRDFTCEIAGDLLEAREGDLLADGKRLNVRRGVEVGHIFSLGTSYSESLNAGFLDENQKKVPYHMGSYGVGISRTIAAILEQNYDEFGIIWPIEIAPYQVIITTVNAKDDDQMKISEEIYDVLNKKYEVMWDDRQERAGVKFNDRDLIGIPIRITVGKDIADGLVELSSRKDIKNVKKVNIKDLEKEIESMIEVYK